MSLSNNRIHSTEHGDSEVRWCLDGVRIHIVSLHDAGSDVPWASWEVGDGPELADAREQWPGRDAMWDAVRRDYWRTISAPQTILSAIERNDSR